jgi:hypothetical protein
VFELLGRCLEKKPSERFQAARDVAFALEAASTGLRGKITAVRIEGDEIIQTFGSGAAARIEPRAVSKNHIYWQGGDLRFGKLTMRATDLELIDEDPSDPFDFSVAHYNDMLVAGYSKNLARLGLRTYLPDYNDIKAGRPTAAGPAAARPAPAPLK